MANDTFDNQALYAACLNDGSDVQAAAYEVLWAYLHRIAYWMLRERSDAEAMASDCAQQALIKIHNSLAQCHDPAAFRPWAARVLHRVVFDELRRPEHTRTSPIPEDDDHLLQLAVPGPTEQVDLRALLLEAIQQGPLSDRSRRVIIGRYFDEQPDETLAGAETALANQRILPAHIQVTRAKNLASLRRDAELLDRLRDLLT